MNAPDKLPQAAPTNTGAAVEERVALTRTPLTGSHKIYIPGERHPDMQVPMRAIHLTNGEVVTVYDTSGAYTDPNVAIYVRRGLPEIRNSWIEARGDTERYEGRSPTLVDDGQRDEDRLAQLRRESQGLIRTPRRAKAGQNVTVFAEKLKSRTAVLLVNLVGGRIVPSFTLNWLRQRGRADAVTPFGRADEVVTAISKSLKALAKDAMCPVIALAQLNRALETREDKRPLLSDLRDSGSIEQDADQIIMLYRDIVYNEDANPNTAELILRKNRHGRDGTVHVAFRGGKFESGVG